MAVEKVLINKIRPNPFNPRKDYDQDSIAELASEMKSLGRFPAPLLGREVNNHVELAFGHRRFAAMKRNGEHKIEIEIRDLTDEQMRLQAIAENMQRVELSPLEKAEAVAELCELYGGPEEHGVKTKVAKMLGMDSSVINRYCQAAALPKSTKALISGNKIALDSAVISHRIAGTGFTESVSGAGTTRDTVQKIAWEIGKIKDPATREKIKKAAKKGWIKKPEDVIRKAKSKPSEEKIPDLGQLLMQSQLQIDVASETLEALAEFGYAARTNHQWKRLEKSLARLTQAVEVIANSSTPKPTAR